MGSSESGSNSTAGLLYRMAIGTRSSRPYRVVLVERLLASRAVVFRTLRRRAPVFLTRSGNMRLFRIFFFLRCRSFLLKRKTTVGDDAAHETTGGARDSATLSINERTERGR